MKTAANFILSGIAIAVLFLFNACTSSEAKTEVHEALIGNWLLIAPDHKLKNDKQREIYGKYQDSLVRIYGLKLISFEEDGSFVQADSFYSKKGKWVLTSDNKVLVRGGGKGFEDFAVDFARFVDGRLELIEMIPMEGESIKIVWFLKKVNDDDDGDILFNQHSHKWRKKPTSPESEKEIRERLNRMLVYYADYFELVDKESSYFSKSRVFLPFSYYQHAMGVTDFNEDSEFANFFYDTEQAKMAHDFLERAVKAMEDEFPNGSNFIDEYSKFMRMLAKYIAA